MTVEYQAIEFKTAGEALQHVNASGWGVAIQLDGPKVVTRQEADRLSAAGVEFAYLFDHEMPDGTFRIMSVPVN